MANDEFTAWLIAVYSVLMMVSIVVQVVESHKKSRILEQFCAEMDRASVRGGKAEVPHRSWSITVSMEAEPDPHHFDGDGVSLPTNTTREYTKVTASYLPTDDFQFRIYPKRHFSRLGGIFGMRDVNLGDPSFDSLFVVQGSDEAKLHELLGNPAIRELMRREPKVSVTRKADNRWFFRMLPDEMDELYLEVDERIEDVDRLKSLATLASEFLDELVSIGSASEGGSSSEVRRSREIVSR
ncbi:MAG: hypothetical protein WD049_09030 [Candidatus Paceibacterota bacterium]